MNKQQVQLRIGGKLVTVPVDNGGLQAAHGKGLDGKTQVHSLMTGTSRQVPAGKHLVTDEEGNTIMASPDELFTALQQVAPDYEITAKKIS